MENWKPISVFSISLVITLVRLWGSPSATDRQKAMLQNFTDLVVAGTWATKRSVSKNSISIYRSRMLRYLESTIDLYGDGVLVPNHHLSLHIIECLRNFGPVHSWWAFPFERYNGMIGKLNTNNKPGEQLLVVFTDQTHV